MSFSRTHLFSALFRAIIIVAAGIGTGYLFFGSSIFVLTNSQFQFLLSSITAALFYGASKSLSYRAALTVLLVWYVLSTLIDVHNAWLFIMQLVYVACVAAAVYVYMLLIRRQPFSGLLQRVATMSLLVAFENAFTVLILAAILSVFSHVRTSIVDATISNFQHGALIGLGIGVGIEIAEYLLRLNSFRQFIEGTTGTE